MAAAFDRESFRKAYLEAVDEVFAYWTPAMQEEIARHCHPWREGAIDFRNYLIASETRYSIACETLAQSGGFSRLCDVGGFWGVFPLALTRMGQAVAMTEAMKYYSRSFDPLFEFLAREGVRIIDWDPFAERPSAPEAFDCITVMAVLEHYPHSLRPFMENTLEMLAPEGNIYIEVPNIAYWPRRKAMLLGHSPLVSVSEIYRSETPFIGHHHEFTAAELRGLVELAGLRPVAMNRFNYSFRGSLLRRFISEPSLTLASMFPSMRECVAVLACRG